MKKNISVLCCLFLLSTTSLFADNSLTLGDALKFAISNNELINASAKTKDFCEYKFKVAKGKYLPNIFIDGYVNKIQMISRVTDLKYKIVQSLTKKLDTLFLTMPISGEVRLTQYAGRLHRKDKNKKEILIYDYIDNNFSKTRNMFLKRKKTYEKLGYEIIE